MSKKRLYTFLFCIWALCLSHCGDGDSLNNGVEMTIYPEVPLVIDSDLILFPGTDNELTIGAPWFVLQPEFVNNNESEILFVVGLDLDISSAAGNAEFFVSPASTCTLDTATRSYIVILQPGESFIGNASTFPNACDPAAYRQIGNGTRESFYVYGLPERSGVFTYGATVTAKGWIADSSGTPIERLVKQSLVITQ